MSEYKKVFDENCSLYYRILSDYLIKNGWKNLSIADYLKETTPYPSKESVLSKNYQKQGKYPIVSQSKDLISGYCDDESLINKIEKPIIIFGDHTQVVKYVDFDFVLGADGTKIITVTNDYVPKFFYYLIKSIDLHSNKYARHYSLLRKQFIPFKKDSLDIQNSIINYFEDLKNNTLKNKFYFSEKIESIILQLHKALLNINTINSEIESQKAYAKQLRQNILKDAIEGKLTAEWRKTHPVIKGNPDFEAEALFEEIQKEKKSDKKQKELAPIGDDEKTFEIPEGWKWVRLGEICYSITDGDHQAPPKVKNGIPFLVISDVSSGKIEFKGKRFVPQEYFNQLPKERIPTKNSLLYTVTGSYGIPIIVNDLQFCVQRHIAIIKPVIAKLSNKFLFYYFQSAYCKKIADSVAWGVAVKTVPINALRNYCVPFPPIQEQKEIVSSIEKLLLNINQLELQITQREEYANQLMQSILKDAFNK